MTKHLQRFILFLLFNGVVFSAYTQNAPDNFEGTASGTNITLTWDPENGDPDNEGYIIKARINPGGVFPATPTFGSLPIVDDADLTDGAGMIQISDEDIDTYAGFMNLVAGAQYDFEIYTYDDNSISSSASTTVYTWATAPGAFPGGFTFSATVDGNEIDLAFTKASTLPLDAHGYLVLRRDGSDPDLTGVNDGSAPGGTYHIATITDSTDTDFTDNTALGGVTYHYALVPYRVVFNGMTPVDETYNYGALSSIATATIPLVTTITEITGGIAPSPLASGANTRAILGFSITSNGAPNFTAINIQTTSNAAHKFTDAYLYESANNSFGGDAPVASVSDNLTAGEIQLSGFSVGLSSTPKFFFIVVDLQDTVSSSSPTLTPSFTNANVTISGSGTVTVNSSPITGTTYSFVDNTAPTIVSETPADGSTGVSVVLSQFTVTFNEPVQYVGDNSNDDNRIRIRDDDSNTVVETISVSDVSVVGNVVTFTTDFVFNDDTNYDVIIGNSVFEDLAGNDFAGITVNNWEFVTEASPDITSLSNTTRCIADQLTINGFRFTGTGGSGNTKPVVTINGVTVHPDSIKSFNSTTIVLNVPPGVTTGDVEVINQDNDLDSDQIALTVLTQINTGLSVSPSTTTPAQGTSVTISVGSSQLNYTYDLVLTDKPVGYSVTIGNSVHTAAGGANPLNLNTGEGADPDLTHIGDYSYRIDVSRTGCTTRPLATTVDLTVAALSVTVTATDTTVCIGTNPILIGSTSGGTGFYQFSWVGPNGFTSTSSSPTPNLTHPAGTGWYILTLSDNSANTAKDSVYIETFEIPTATIVPNPGETSVRDNYIVENRDYLVSGTPAGGVFTGQGIVLKSDGKYYFNPFNAGLGSWDITYTYTDANGCPGSDTEEFVVQATTVNGVEQLYCRNRTTDSGITVNVANAIRPGYQFTRIRFYRCTTVCYYDDYPVTAAVVGIPATTNLPVGATYPLTINSVTTVDDASTPLIIGDNITIPASYTLDLDAIRNGWGYGSYYLDVFGKNAAGTEVLQSWAFFQVVDNGPAPSIVGINENENVCADALPIELSSSIAGYVVTDFDMSPGTFSGALSGTTEEDFNPGHASLTGADERPLTISMDYNDFNGCPSTVVRNFNWVKKPNAPNAPDVSYCKITTGVPGTFTINSSPNGPGTNPYWYEQDPILNPAAQVLDSVNFNGFVATGITGLAATTKNFYVTQVYKGCEGSVELVTIEIREAPDASITPGPICEDRTFIVTGPEQSSGTAYKKYVWTFGDGSTQTIEDDSVATHNYGPGSGSTPYSIGLTVTNSLGCSNSDAIPVTVGLNPKPDFEYHFVCDGDQTSFRVPPNEIPVTQFAWDFGDGVTVAPNIADSVTTHQFPGPGTYEVKVTTYTGSDCFNSDSTVVTILEYVTRAVGETYDMSAIEGGQGYWRVQDVSGNTSWAFGNPTSPIMNGKFTGPAWATSLAGNYVSGEESYLNSPCFDIEEIERPVLSFDFIVNTEMGRDGIVLEYSKDGGIIWEALGTINSGFNWFNTPGFTGQIGSGTLGWSGNSWEFGDNPQGDTLVQARRVLDNIDELSSTDRANVRFRIAFKSGNDVQFDGIAFNNVRIESRNRVLLVENFTNEGSANYTGNNTGFINVPSDESVKIQYHLGGPGNDPNYPINTADPSARAAYYGIPLTNQYIPRGYVDGRSNGNFTAPASWVQTQFSQRSLKVAPYTLTVQNVQADNDEYIKVSAVINTLDSIPASSRPVLMLGVVEKTVDANVFVLRKLIPSAVGRALPAPQAAGSITTITDSVRIDNPDVEFADLSIVAFIQDETTREVYQAAVELNPANLPAQVITDVEDPTYAEKISLFPNPANNELTIQLPAGVTTQTPVTMVDTYGRIVYENSFAPGENLKQLSTRELAGGVYVIQVKTPDGGVARKKVMVVHK